MKTKSVMFLFGVMVALVLLAILFIPNTQDRGYAQYYPTATPVIMPPETYTLYFPLFYAGGE